MFFLQHLGLFTQFYSLSFRRYVDTQKLRDAQKKKPAEFSQREGTFMTSLEALKLYPQYVLAITNFLVRRRNK